MIDNYFSSNYYAPMIGNCISVEVMAQNAKVCLETDLQQQRLFSLLEKANSHNSPGRPDLDVMPASLTERLIQTLHQLYMVRGTSTQARLCTVWTEVLAPLLKTHESLFMTNVGRQGNYPCEFVLCVKGKGVSLVEVFDIGTDAARKLSYQFTFEPTFMFHCDGSAPDAQTLDNLMAKLDDVQIQIAKGRVVFFEETDDEWEGRFERSSVSAAAVSSTHQAVELQLRARLGRDDDRDPLLRCFVSENRDEVNQIFDAHFQTLSDKRTESTFKTAIQSLQTNLRMAFETLMVSPTDTVLAKHTTQVQALLLYVQLVNDQSPFCAVLKEMAWYHKIPVIPSLDFAALQDFETSKLKDLISIKKMPTQLLSSLQRWKDFSARPLYIKADHPKFYRLKADQKSKHASLEILASPAKRHEGVFESGEGRFVPRSSVDVDHIHPIQEILERIEKLIQFINALPPTLKGLQLLLIRQNPGCFLPYSNGIVGSKYLYASYYNYLNNLWLMDKYVNSVQKGGKGLAQWVEISPMFCGFSRFILEESAIRANTTLHLMDFLDDSRVFFRFKPTAPVLEDFRGLSLNKVCKRWMDAVQSKSPRAQRLFIAYSKSESLLLLSRTILQTVIVSAEDAQRLAHLEKAVSKEPNTERRNMFRTFILDLASKNPDVADCVGAFVSTRDPVLVLSDDSSQDSYENEKDRLLAQERLEKDQIAKEREALLVAREHDRLLLIEKDTRILELQRRLEIYHRGQKRTPNNLGSK